MTNTHEKKNPVEMTEGIDREKEAYISTLGDKESEYFLNYQEDLESYRRLEPVLAKLSDEDKKIFVQEWDKPRREKLKELTQAVPDGERRSGIMNKAIELYNKKYGISDQKKEQEYQELEEKKYQNIEPSEQLTPENIEAAVKKGKPLKVRVQRTSGEFENGWMAMGYNPDSGRVRLFNNEGEGRLIKKDIPFEELIDWQKEISPEELQKELQKVESFEDLSKLLQENGGIQGSREFFSAEQLLGVINKVRKGELQSNAITRTGGLRQKVEDLLTIEKHRNTIQNQ